MCKSLDLASCEWYKRWWFGKETTISLHEWMALKAATLLFSTVTALTCQASKPADCDPTVCYMLVLSCGGIAKYAIPNSMEVRLCHLVWMFGSVSLSLDPSVSHKPKVMCLSDLCNVIRFNSQGLIICNDWVLNKPDMFCFFYYLSQALCSFFESLQVTTHACCT